MARLKEKIAYALGDAAAGGIVWKVMSIAFPLFFTNVFGLSFADAAVLMLVARMFDVVTAPLMGSLADRTQSRFGTYRPWLIYGAIALFEVGYQSTRGHLWKPPFARLRSCGQANLCLRPLSADDGGIYHGECALRLIARCDDRG